MSKVVVFDALTETEFVRDMTEQELAQKAIDQANQNALEMAQAEAQAKRSAALAKLGALGLDEDDLKALSL